MEGKEIYLVVFDWSVEDGQDCDITAFDSYGKALREYLAVLEDELNGDCSWVGDCIANGYADIDTNIPEEILKSIEADNAYNEYPKLCEDLVTHKQPLYYNIVNSTDPSYADFIELRCVKLY